MLTEPSQQQEKSLFYWLKIREKERDMLVREKRDPLVRRPPIRMGIGVLLFNIPYYLILIRLDSAGISFCIFGWGCGFEKCGFVTSGFGRISWFRWECICCIG